MLRIIVVALVVLVAAMMLMPRNGELIAPPEVATVLPQPRELPAVAFVDQAGMPFAIEDLAGRYSLLFFGFTNCPDICPLTLQVLAQATAEIEARAPDLVPQVVLVSVDPQRDTPKRIRSYVTGFDPRFIGVTAPDNALEPLLGTMGVMVHKDVTDDGQYTVVHNGTVFVLDDAGRWVALFGGSSHEASVIASDYLRIRLRAREPAPQ